jgi:hypothetical protein
VGNRLRQYGQGESEGFTLADIPHADIALYFPDTPSKLYQLKQWLPIFESGPRPTIVVTRSVETYDALAGTTPLRVLLVPTFEELMALYDKADFRCVVYVNNGWSNFQSLAYQEAVHIHVNHGESDKICMVSNQAKAYDRVFVAGDAAIERHRAALAWFDESHLIPVGRPQLDLAAASPVGAHPGTTITYAPTWEGEDEANNYTSVDRYGVALVEAALAQPGARVLYKPHPRIETSTTPSIRRAHDHIVQSITQAGPPHAVLTDADVLGVIRTTDLMIADVSSVTLDHLYLRPEAPILLCDRRSDPERLAADTPLARAVTTIDATSIPRAQAILASLIADDAHRGDRLRMRSHYFGAGDPGESTRRFWDQIDRAISDHDTAMRNLNRTRVTGEV